MNKIKLFLIGISTVMGIVTGGSSAALAAGCNNTGLKLLPAWYDGLDCEADGGVKLTGKPLPEIATQIALNIASIILYIVGYASFAFLIWGGFKFMIQGDNSSGVAAARKTIMNAVIGLLISIFSIAIVNLVGTALG